MDPICTAIMHTHAKQVLNRFRGDTWPDKTVVYSPGLDTGSPIKIQGQMTGASLQLPNCNRLAPVASGHCGTTAPEVDSFLHFFWGRRSLLWGELHEVIGRLLQCPEPAQGLAQWRSLIWSDPRVHGPVALLTRMATLWNITLYYYHTVSLLFQSSNYACRYEVQYVPKLFLYYGCFFFQFHPLQKVLCLYLLALHVGNIPKSAMIST